MTKPVGDQSTMAVPAPQSAVGPTQVTSEGNDTGADGNDAQGGSQPPNRQERRDEAVRAERDALKAERDGLNARLDAVRWREVRRAAEGRLMAPDDLLLVASGDELAALWTDDGELDEPAVNELLDRVVTERPSWRRSAPAPSDGLGPKADVPSAAGASWGDVLRSPFRR